MWRRCREGIFARNSYALADQVVYSFGNMVVAAMLSRHCAQREFGIYILTQRSMDVVIQLSNVFLWAPFTFNLPGTEKDHRPAYEGSIFFLQLLLCLGFTLLMVLACRWAGTSSRSMYLRAFAPLVFAMGGILFREFTRRMYFAHMRLREAFWTDVATVGLQILAVEWLYRAGKLDVAHTLPALCVGAVLVSLWWVFRDSRQIAIRFDRMADDMRLNLRLGRWFLGTNMIYLAISQSNPWLLSSMLGGASVGAYAVCESVVNIPRVALNSMQNIMGPVVARAHDEGGKTAVRRIVSRLDRTLLAGASFCAVVVMLLGTWVARVIFNTVPENAHLILILLAMNLVAFAATLAQTFGLSALGRADTTLYANAIALLVQCTLCFGLVHRFGVSGAAGAMLLGNLAGILARGVYYRKEMCIGPATAIPIA